MACLTKNMNPAWCAAVSEDTEDQKTLRGGGFVTSINTLMRGLDPSS